MPDDAPRLMPSVLDRLLDPESMGGRVAGYDHRRMADSVRIDLEELLNARVTFHDIPPEYPETVNSVLTYGMPDLSRFDVGVDRRRVDLAKAVQAVVNRFEPRLRKVRVTVVGVPGPGGLTLKFKIEAELNVDPAPEVGFETVVELTTGRATVTESGAGG